MQDLRETKRLQIPSQSHLLTRRRDFSQRCKLPRGDHTIGLARSLQPANVGIVGNEYTPVRWTTSAQRINGGNS